MEYLFLFAIVTPLALLVLNLTGFRAGSSPATTMGATDTVVAPSIPAAPEFTPAVEVSAPAPAEPRSILGRGKRHRRDFFGDYSEMPAQTIIAPEPVDAGAEIYLLPRRDVAPAMTLSGPPAAHARPGGNLVPLPRHTPLVATASVAQR